MIYTINNFNTFHNTCALIQIQKNTLTKLLEKINVPCGSCTKCKAEKLNIGAEAFFFLDFCKV